MNIKRNFEIYRKHKQGIKTGILIKTYNLSRQRLHQIFKQEKLKEEKLEKENAKIILEQKEVINKMKKAKLCGTCYFYNSNGFCNHTLSTDSCADRDSKDACNIGQYKYDKNK